MNASRICDRLRKAELAEPNTHLRTDIRQAFITVSLAGRDEPQPFVQASYRVYGTHPDMVFPKWLAEQKARLGREFDLWYDQAGILRPDVPKKTSAPVTPHPDEQVPERLAAVLSFPRRANDRPA